MTIHNLPPKPREPEKLTASAASSPIAASPTDAKVKKAVKKRPQEASEEERATKKVKLSTDDANKQKGSNLLPDPLIGLVGAYMSDEEHTATQPWLIAAMSGNPDTASSRATNARKAVQREDEKRNKKVYSTVEKLLAGKVISDAEKTAFKEQFKSVYIIEGLNTLLQEASTEHLGTILRFLSDTCPQLRALDLSNCKVTPEIVVEVARFANLQELSLKNCEEVTSESLKALQSLLKLESISLSSTAIVGNGAEHLSLSLVRLEICDTDDLFTDKHLSSLKNKMKLEFLRIEGAPITGESFSELSPLLRELRCSGCRNITDDAISALQNKKTLQLIDFSFTAITGSGFVDAPSSIREVNCSNCGNLTDDGLKGLASKKALEVIDVSATPVDGSFFIDLPLSTKKLNCSSCPQLLDESIAALQTKVHLEEVDFSDTSIQGSSFSDLPDSLTRLRCAGCPNVKDKTLKALATKEKLASLDIADTSTRGSCFVSLPPSLQEINFSRCVQLIEAALQGLTDKKALTVVNMQGCLIKGTHLGALPSSLVYLLCRECTNLECEAIKRLDNHLHFKKLEIGGTPFTAEDVKAVRGGIEIVEIDDSGNEVESDCEN